MIFLRQTGDPSNRWRRHTGSTLCGAVYFNLLEDLSFYGGFDKFWRASSARDVFEFVLGQFVRLVR